MGLKMESVHQVLENDCESPGTTDVTSTHECFFPEEGFELEGGLYKRVCKKNPGHEAFIPIKDLCKEHLPNDCDAHTMLECIKRIAPLTVRIRARRISHQRPKSLLHDKTIKPGTPVCYYGTGYVYASPKSLSPCPCADCCNRPGTTGYEIRLKTSAHVIYDTEEANEARIDFYADDSKDISSILTLPGWQVRESFSKMDSCYFSTLTHDENIFTKLQSEFKAAADSFRDLKKTLHGNNFPYFFIISHPHGYCKHISFGSQFKFVFSETSGHNGGFLMYNTPTCPGSSGAHVTYGSIWPRSDYEPPHGPHHGVNQLDPKTNRSGSYVTTFRAFTYLSKD